LDIVKKVESVIENIRPNIIYTHFPYDLNIDHRITFQAVLTVCRPQPNFNVKNIFAFETLSSTEWQIKDAGNMFLPNKYNNITDFIEKKIEIIKVYQDEIKEFPHPRSIDGIMTLAKYRGMEVGYRYAEAFQVIRIIKD
jgi:LmbE family N-acetylglucosaminyl deacetylase